MNKDLTVGKPSTVLWKFCLPLFGSVIFQQLYNIADSLVAGKFVGELALAAVGNSYEITLIFIAFAFGCNIGCSVIVSQLFGAKRYGELKSAVYTTLIAGGILCALLMAVGLTFSEQLLNLINTPKNIMADSALYLDIYILGLPFVFFYNIATGIFSALGDSRTPFIFLACSSVSNIGMDILFVTALGMKVDGVAWATFICQGVSCIAALIVVFRRFAAIKTDEPSQIFSFTLLRRISVIAVPSILQQSFISVGNIIIQGVINGFGAPTVAGYSAAIKLNNLLITSFTTLGNGISNYTAQNLGAGKFERIRPGFRAGVCLSVLLSIPFTLAYLTLGRSLVALFLDSPSETALNVGRELLMILSPFYFAVAAKLTADGVLRGAGHMDKFMISTFTDLVLRVVLAIVLSRVLGSVGIWVAWPIGWVIGSAVAVYFYIRENGKRTSKCDIVS